MSWFGKLTYSLIIINTNNGARKKGILHRNIQTQEVEIILSYLADGS